MSLDPNAPLVTDEAEPKALKLVSVENNFVFVRSARSTWACHLNGFSMPEEYPSIRNARPGEPLWGGGTHQPHSGHHHVPVKPAWDYPDPPEGFGPWIARTEEDRTSGVRSDGDSDRTAILWDDGDFWEVATGADMSEITHYALPLTDTLSGGLADRSGDHPEPAVSFSGSPDAFLDRDWTAGEAEAVRAKLAVWDGGREDSPLALDANKALATSRAIWLALGQHFAALIETPDWIDGPKEAAVAMALAAQAEACFWRATGEEECPSVSLEAPGLTLNDPAAARARAAAELETE